MVHGIEQRGLEIIWHYTHVTIYSFAFSLVV